VARFGAAGNRLGARGQFADARLVLLSKTQGFEALQDRPPWR